jgi:hypothetical protein
LAHLGARDAHHHGVVGPDHDPGADFRRAVLGAQHVGSAERKVQAERESAAGGRTGDDEGTAIHLRNEIHFSLPYALAAA